MSETVRVFVAVQPSEEVAEAIWQVQEHLHQFPPLQALRWVDPDDAHITLKFLGDVPIPTLPAIVEALDGVAASWEPFPAKLGTLGAFPNVHRPDTIWLGVEEGERALHHLYNAVEVSLKRIGFKPERKPFHPHLTLARVPKSWGSSQQAAAGELIGPTAIPDLPAFTVEAIALIRSTLTPEGSIYQRLANARFGEVDPLGDDDWEDEL